MTDLGNRRFLDENMPLLFDSVCASRTELICLALDLDDFKHVNDTQGHAMGDELLKALAGLLRATLRHDDLAIRLGGDEFVVLLPGCDLERAGQLASNWHLLFGQQARSLLPADVTCGVSIGIASLRRDAPASAEALLQAADANLYAAKRAGKGHTVGG